MTEVPNAHVLAAKRVTCVVVDDHPGLVEFVCTVLSGIGVEVVGRARTAADAIARVGALNPTLAVVDVRLGADDGIALTREIATISPETAVVLYTGFGDDTLLGEALDAGARGVVLKDAPVDDLVRALKVVASGGTYVDPVLGGAAVATGADRRFLSDRERDIMRLLADGLANEQIAKRLFIAPETVRKHIRTAMEKLGASTRTQAVAEAIRRRLIR